MRALCLAQGCAEKSTLYVHPHAPDIAYVHQNSNLQQDVSFGNKCVYTSRNLLMKSKIPQLLRSTSKDENSVGGRDPTLSETSSSREQVCSEKRTVGPTHGVIQTRSESHRNPNAPTLEERSIEWTLCLGAVARLAAWILHKNVHKNPVHTLRVQMGFSTKSREHWLAQVKLLFSPVMLHRRWVLSMTINCSHVRT